MAAAWDVLPTWLNRGLRGINTLAVPFLTEDDGGEDDYDLLPPPRPLTTLQLMGIAFFAVSGSAYGVEEIVPAGGPFLSLLSLLLAPVVWSAPMLMITSELSVALPRSGGYIVWIEESLGAMPSLLNGVSNLLCNVLDCSLYPLLLTQYLREVFVIAAARGGGDDAVNPSVGLSEASLGLVRLLLVGLAAGLNVIGINVVGAAAGVLMLVVSLPFVALVAAAAAQPHADPSVWFDADPRAFPSGRSGWYFFGCLILWNCCGYDSAGMVAAEVRSPRSAYPRALWGTLILTTLLYVLPLAAALATATHWETWEPGQYAALGAELGGPWLEFALAAASVVSMVGVLCTLLCTSSRAIAGMDSTGTSSPTTLGCSTSFSLSSKPSMNVNITGEN